MAAFVLFTATGCSHPGSLADGSSAGEAGNSDDVYGGVGPAESFGHSVAFDDGASFQVGGFTGEAADVKVSCEPGLPKVMYVVIRGGAESKTGNDQAQLTIDGTKPESHLTIAVTTGSLAGEQVDTKVAVASYPDDVYSASYKDPATGSNLLNVQFQCAR